jgi:hypothetical protein
MASSHSSSQTLKLDHSIAQHFRDQLKAARTDIGHCHCIRSIVGRLDKGAAYRRRGHCVQMNTKELIDRISNEPGIKFELTEFENLGKPIREIRSIYLKVATTGKDAGKTKYYLKSFIPFSTGNEEVQVYAEGGKSAPEGIVRKLWVYAPITA